MCRIGLATLFVALLSAIGGVAEAALIERDLETPGDGLLTFDPSTGLEWLDVSQTLLEDFPVGTLVEDRYQAVVAETLSGGKFEGFSVANEAQAEQLALSAGIVPGTFEASVNDAAVASLLSLIGTTEFIPGNRERLTGLLSGTDDPFGFGPLRNALLTDRSPPNSVGFVVAPFYSVDLQTFPHPDADYGVLLVRDVPEPSYVAIVIPGALVALRYQRRCDR